MTTYDIYDYRERDCTQCYTWASTCTRLYFCSLDSHYNHQVDDRLYNRAQDDRTFSLSGLSSSLPGDICTVYRITFHMSNWTSMLK